MPESPTAAHTPTAPQCPYESCERIKEAAEAAARATTKDVFERLGIDLEDPQKVAEFQNTIHFARTVNNTISQSISRFFTTLAALLAGWIAYKVGFGK